MYLCMSEGLRGAEPFCGTRSLPISVISIVQKNENDPRISLLDVAVKLIWRYSRRVQMANVADLKKRVPFEFA